MSEFLSRRPLPWIVLVCMMTACASTRDIPLQLPDAEEAISATDGAIIKISEYTSNTTWKGELIAVDADSVFLLSGIALVGIPCGNVREAKLFVVDYPLRRSIILWTTLGVLSTASHGGYLVFSLPVWLLAGTLTNTLVVHDADAGDVRFPGVPWTEIRKFARFPQGFPSGLDRSRLRNVSRPSRH